MEWAGWDVRDLQGKTGPDRDRRPALGRLGTHRHRPDRAGRHPENASGSPGSNDTTTARCAWLLLESADRGDRPRASPRSPSGSPAEAVFGGELPANEAVRHQAHRRARSHDEARHRARRRARDFVITWHFPNLSLPGTRLPADLGRHYATRFASAADVARYLAKNQRPARSRDTRLWHQTWYDSTLAPLVPGPDVRQHVDPGDLDLPPVQERTVLRLGRRGLLRGDLHPRLALRPCRGPALPRTGADPPRAGRLRRGHRLRPQDRHHQPPRRGAGRAGGRRPGGEHPADLSRAPDVGRRGVPEAALAAGQGRRSST